MRHAVFFSRLVPLILALALSSCGVGEDRTQEGASSSARAARSARGRTGVSLKPPYSEWKWGKQDKEARISVQNAVQAVARQAGISYNRQKSYRNTTPICRQWTYPDFENKPWEEAIEEILAPFDLTYVMENKSIVLMKLEEAARRDRVRHELAAEVSRMVSSEAQPSRLHDAVIVFPLLNGEGKTTELGTLLSLLGTLKATYTPQKTFNLHVPCLIDYYHEKGYGRAGKSFKTEERDRITARFRARDSASGTIEVADNGSFRIVLHFEGQHGTREFSLGGTRDDLNGVPQWIARCILEYCQIHPSPEQDDYLKWVGLRDPKGLFKLLELESEYRAGRIDRRQWTRLVRLNPDSVFALYRYCLISEDVDDDDSLSRITTALRGLGDHELLKFLEAEWHQRDEDYPNSVPRFLELLKGDFRNDALHERMDNGLLAFGLGDSAVSLHNFWIAHDPDSYLPLLSKGTFYVAYAWDARGGGWGWTVTEERGKMFEERLHVAEELLARAYELNPTDPRAPTMLMKVTRGLGHARDQMEDLFNRAVQADPQYYGAYEQKLTYLMPKWGGSSKEMFAFARACAAHPPEGSRVALILVDAHSEMARRSAGNGRDWTSYYEDPEVWEEIKAVYERYLQEHPDSMWDRNYFAQYAYFANDYAEAVRQFKHIGTNIDKRCWGSEEYFYRCRTKAYAEAEGDMR